MIFKLKYIWRSLIFRLRFFIFKNKKRNPKLNFYILLKLFLVLKHVSAK